MEFLRRHILASHLELGRWCRRVSTLVVASFGVVSAAGQAPVNDNFAAAQVISGQTGRVLGTNNNATREA
ncbi:MAG: hypothetical protein QOF48_2878, partial [Verrucomicrobiota bacterium]